MTPTIPLLRTRLWVTRLLTLLPSTLTQGTYRPYQGLSDGLDEFISAFLSGDPDSGYKGAYNTHIESIRSQNKRIDERIEDMERYLEQREKTLSDGFMRMEEMQSQLNTQLQTLQNSFKK